MAILLDEEKSKILIVMLQVYFATGKNSSLVMSVRYMFLQLLKS